MTRAQVNSASELNTRVKLEVVFSCTLLMDNFFGDRVSEHLTLIYHV